MKALPKPPKFIHLSSLELSMLLENGTVDVASTKPIRGRTLTARAVIRRYDKRECKVIVREIEPLLYRITRKDEKAA